MNKFMSIPIEDITVSQIKSGQFLSLDFYSISNGPNRNGSDFLEESFEDAIPTFYNKPILAYYNPKDNDVEEHNSQLAFDKYGRSYDDYQYPEAERPCGVIPESAKISVVDVKGKKWIHIEGALLWVEYNRQLAELLQKQGKKSVSVEVEVLESYMDKGIERVKKFAFYGITILGDKFYPGIPNAHLNVKKFAQSKKFASYREKLTYALNDVEDIVNKYVNNNSDNKKEMASTDSAIRGKINSILQNQRPGAYVEDTIIKDKVVVIYDNERGTYFIGHFEIDEDENVKLSNDFVPAEVQYIAKSNFKYKYLSNDEFGTGDAIKIDKSEESVSNDSWGEVNKVTLRNTVLKAKNYKSVVHDVYLLVEDGWEDSPTEHLKYPVMQYKGEKFVYNAGGLLSAQQYGEQHDTKIADKAKSIRKKLGLIESKERDNVNKFIEAAKKDGFLFIGLFDNKLRFAKSVEVDDADEDKCKCTEMTLFEIDKEKCSDTEEFSADKLEKKSIKMADEKEDEPKKEEAPKEDSENKGEKKTEAKDDGKEKCASEPEKKEEAKDENKETNKSRCSQDKETFSSLLAERDKLIKDKVTMAKKIEDLSSELAAIKKAQFVSETDKILSAEDDEVDDNIRKYMLSAREQDKYASVEDFVKDMSYQIYLKKEERRNFANSISFDLASTKEVFRRPDMVVDPTMAALDEI